MQIEPLGYQYDPITDFTHQYQAFCGGYGAGKSYVMLSKVCLWASMNPHLSSVIMGPTFSELSLYTTGDFEDILEELEIPYTCVKYPFPKYVLEFEDGDHTVRMLSIENTNRLKGFKTSAFFFDEIETIQKDIAKEAFEKALSRLREGHGFKFMGFYSTPNQKGWMYDNFIKDPLKNSILYRAKTEQNIYLPKDYIENLKEVYPANMIAAYMNGEYVNLSTNRVYSEFCDILNSSNRTVQIGDQLHIGIDFNQGIMAAVVAVLDNGKPIIVDEFHGDSKTQDLIKSINKRYPDHKIIVYPDASGNAEKTNSPLSDMTQLKNAFGKANVKHPRKNPLIPLRLNVVNMMILNGHNERQLKININNCPKTVDALLSQPFKNGKPDKAHEYDDIADALGYLLFVLFGKRTTSKIKLKGF